MYPVKVVIGTCVVFRFGAYDFLFVVVIDYGVKLIGVFSP
jgi:hypothetical protein